MKHRVLAAAAALAASAVLSSVASSPAWGQLRIVTMNASNSSGGNAGPRTGMQTILDAIGSTVLDDPTTTGPNTGIAKRVDVLCLQEVHLNGTTPQLYANLLNAMYGTTTYSAGTMIGGSSGSGSQGVVYNSATVHLLSDVAVGTVDMQNGMARQALRHEFSVVGYDSAANFYIYNSHYKSSSGDTARRLAEATIIRNDADALGPNKNILYLGDYNVFTSNESGYQKLLSAGNGQANDPINKAGAWNGSATFKDIHTQTPYDAAIGQPGFDGAGGMDSRFDIQLITNNLNDRHGLAYIPDSYQCFGNNGSHQLGMPLNTGSGAPPAVLTALSSILDHLPVGADYQLPAKMSVSVASVPSQVIVGANTAVEITVINSAPVTFSNGADKLAYAFSGSDSVSGSGNGSNLAALSPGNQHSLNISTATPGVKNGAVNVTGTSEAVANGTFSQNVSTTVLAHATPSFDSVSGVNVATIDFGIKGRDLGGGTGAFAISNLADVSGFTAALDLDSIVGGGSTAQLTTNAATFSNLAAGSSQPFAATLDASSNGTLSATYTFNLSDQNLPGATVRGPLSLVLKAIVATPGDTDLNNVIDGADYARIDSNFNNQAGQGDIGGWFNGDFDGNNKIDGTDYALIDFYFNDQSNFLPRALSFLDGSDRDRSDMIAPSLRLMLQHFDSFGPGYALAFLNTVPEPVTIALAMFAFVAIAGSGAGMRRRSRKAPAR